MNDEQAWISLVIRVAVAYLCFDLLLDAIAHYRASPTPRGIRWVVLTALVAFSGAALFVGALARLQWIPQAWAVAVGIAAAAALLVGLLYLWISRRWGPYR